MPPTTASTSATTGPVCSEATITSAAAPTCDHTGRRTARPSGTIPALTRLTTTRVTALVLWLTSPARMPAIAADGVVLTAPWKSRRAAGPAKGVRLAAMKRTPQKNRPSPVSRGARTLIVGKAALPCPENQGRTTRTAPRPVLAPRTPTPPWG